jgi:SAM-dependent methyltransferase
MDARTEPSRTTAPVRTCRLCGRGLEHRFVDLGMSPLCESFVPPEAEDDMEAFYPLRTFVCDGCFLVQLGEYVSPDHIFSEYAYFSSYSASWLDHARRYATGMTGRLGLGADSLVVELASNDGYLLRHFRDLGVPVLGIDPAANVARVAREAGIETIVDFFGVRLARGLVARGIRADLIAANNVLAQVPDLHDFVGGIAILLAPAGRVTIEVPHLDRLVEENQFDTIYHEHFSYFSAIAVDRLARDHGLRIAEIEELPTHGGSLRLHLVHAASDAPEHPSVAAMIARERARGMDTLAYYARFEEKVRRTKRELLSFLIGAKAQGRRICGYGAPGKSATLLNYCGIGTDFLDFTVDRNPYKHGRLTPGTRIPIRPVEAIFEARPDYVLILPWNLATEIRAQMAGIAAWGGRFVVPIPEVRVHEAGDAR